MHKILVGGDNTTKTAYMLNRIRRLSDIFNGKIVVVDAKNDDRSLLKRFVGKNPDAKVIDIKELLGANTDAIKNLDAVLEHEIKNGGDKIAIDLSYLYEKAHSTKDIGEIFGDLYKFSAIKTINALNHLSQGDDSGYMVFMKDVELPAVQADAYNPNRILYMASVSPENCVEGSFYDNFERMSHETLLDGK